MKIRITYTYDIQKEDKWDMGKGSKLYTFEAEMYTFLKNKGFWQSSEKSQIESSQLLEMKEPPKNNRLSQTYQDKESVY